MYLTFYFIEKKTTKVKLLNAQIRKAFNIGLENLCGIGETLLNLSQQQRVREKL